MTGCKMAALALMESDMQYVVYLNFDDFVTVDSYFVCIKLELMLIIKVEDASALCQFQLQ